MGFVIIITDLGNFSEQAVNHTVFFYPNGTPFLYLEIEVWIPRLTFTIKRNLVSFQLPSTICSCQKVVYGIEIEDINSGEFEMLGPFNHVEPRLHVKRKIVSAILQRDNNYTMTVTVESSGKTSTSQRYFFSKSCLFSNVLMLFTVTFMFLRNIIVILSADDL